MAIAVKAVSFALVAQVLGIAAIVMVLIWTISFRGGLAWEASNKNLIFNVSLPDPSRLFVCPLALVGYLLYG